MAGQVRRVWQVRRVESLQSRAYR